MRALYKSSKLKLETLLKRSYLKLSGRNMTAALLLRTSAVWRTGWLLNPCSTLGHSRTLEKCSSQIVACHQRRFKFLKPSYTHGTGNVTLVASTIGQRLEYIVDRHADSEAVVDCHQGIRKNYAQYNKDIDNLAKGLLHLNLKRGDRIGILAPNRYEWLVTQFAAAKAGLILVTINPANQTPELEYCIRKVEMRALVSHDLYKTQDYYQMMATIIPEIRATKPASKIRSAKYPYFDTLIVMTDKDLPGAFKYDDVLQAGGSAEEQLLDKLRFQIQCHDPANIQYTSGTTGQPKATTLTHFSIVNQGIANVKRFAFDKERATFGCQVPLFHAIGCVIIAMDAAMNGLKLVLPSPGFDPGAVLKSVEDHKCTQMYGTPTMLIELMEHPNFKTTDLSSLKSGIIGGAPVSPHLLRTLIEKVGISRLVVAYGSTETCGCLFSSLPDDSLEDKTHTCGRVFELMEAKIVDEKGDIVPVGTCGEICARGYRVMLKYWGDEKATKEAFTEDGFYKTGDAGTLQEDGSLVMSERIKDMIIRGGENIFPREIEDFLATHPKIVEIQVVGAPDERMGEEVSAWIVLRQNETMTESEVKDYCKGKIAYFKVPRYIQFVSTLPKTPSGKVQKYVLKQQMREILTKK